MAKTDKRVQAVIDSAQQALKHLRDRIEIPPKLAHDIEGHIRQSFSTLSAPSIASRAKDFDAYGTDIWNAAADVLHENNEPRDPRLRTSNTATPGVLFRIFALLLLDASHHISPRRAKDPGQKVRLFKVSNRTARLCLERSQLDLSMTALEIGSKHLSPPAEAAPLVQFSSTQEVQMSDHEVAMKSLEREYYLLRVLHAWRSERQDLADHFFHSWTKVDISDADAKTDALVKAADLFYEFARHLTKIDDAAAAAKWYDRALAALWAGDVELVGRDSSELLMSIAVAYVEELLKTGQTGSYSRAQEIIAQLESSNGLSNRLALPVLKLRVLVNVKQVDPQELHKALLGIARLCVLTEENFKMVMQTIRKAHELQPNVAIAALQYLIVERILPEVSGLQGASDQVNVWLEKASITFALYATNRIIAAGENHVDGLLSLFDKLKKQPGVHFTAKATHAAQTLIWKATSVPDSTVAQQCCLLLQHPLFENAGYINKGRIGRKLMRAALGANDFAEARRLFLEMPAEVQNEPATRYSAFQLALREGNQDLAEDSLRVVLKGSGADPMYLYACVLDAQQHPNMKQMAVIALKAILHQRPPGMQLGALLRCMARLLIVEASNSEIDANVIAGEIAAVFEMAASSMKELRKCPPEQWRTEVLWWSKNAYNLAIQLCSTIDPQQLLRILSACTEFLAECPDDAGHVHADDLVSRKSLCLFLSTTSLIVLGRSTSQDAELAKEHYKQAWQDIASYRALQQTVKSDNEANSARAFTMVKFELECILRLEQWNRLDSVLQTCLELRTAGRWDTLADLIIVISEHLDANEQTAHTSLITQVLQKIINDSWKKEKDIVRVSRWLRFAFMLCLHHEEGSFARKLLDQASRMAQHGQAGKHDAYPEAELQWLATTGVNHAIDLITNEKMDHIKAWLDAAVEVVRWTQDNGAMHAILTEKREAIMQRIENVEE